MVASQELHHDDPKSKKEKNELRQGNAVPSKDDYVGFGERVTYRQGAKREATYP